MQQQWQGVIERFTGHRGHGEIGLCRGGAFTASTWHHEVQLVHGGLDGDVVQFVAVLWAVVTTADFADHAGGTAGTARRRTQDARREARAVPVAIVVEVESIAVGVDGEALGLVCLLASEERLQASAGALFLLLATKLCVSCMR